MPEFPNTNDLRDFINRFVRNSAVESFTNLRLNRILRSVTEFIDDIETDPATLISADANNEVVLGSDNKLYVAPANLTGYATESWVQSQGYLTSANAALTYVALAGSYANPSWITSLAWSKLTGVPSTFTPSAHTHPLSDLTQSGATSGQVPAWNGTAWAPTTISTSNLYNSNGTLTGNRSLTLGGNSLSVLSGTNTAFHLFSNGRAWFGNGTPVDAGFQVDVSGTARVQGDFSISGTNAILYGPTSVQLLSSTNNNNIAIGSVAKNATTGTNNIYITTGTNGIPTSNNNVIQIGWANTNTGNGSLTLGNTSTALNGGVAIGNSAVANNASGASFAFGISATASGIFSIALGGGSIATVASGDRSVALGHGSTATGANAVAIGNLTSAAQNSIALGWNTKVNQSNIFAAGSNSASISDVYFGSGVQRDGTTNGAGSAYTINGSGALGTNFAGGNITIAGGRGTGSGTAGDVIFSTPTVGASGTTLQTLTNRWWVKGNTGQFANVSNPNASAAFQIDETTRGFLPPRMTAAQVAAIATPATGLMAYDTTNNELDVYDGSNWRALQYRLTNPVTGTGAAGQVSYWTGTGTQGGSNSLLFSPTTELDLANSVTASGAIARGARFRPALTASANNDVLVGLDVNPTFTNGAFTGVQNIGIRATGGSNAMLFRFDSSAGITRSFGAYVDASNFLQLRIPARNTIIHGTGASAFQFGFTTDSWDGLVSTPSTTFRIMGDSTWGQTRFNNASNNPYLTFVHSTQRVIVGGTTDAGFLLDVNGTARVQGNLTLTAGANLVLQTTTGTRIGTATNQLLGFWNATPIAQPTNAIAAAAFVANTSGIVNDTATFGGYTIGQVVQALRNAGLLA